MVGCPSSHGLCLARALLRPGKNGFMRALSPRIIGKLGTDVALVVDEPFLSAQSFEVLSIERASRTGNVQKYNVSSRPP